MRLFSRKKLHEVRAVIALGMVLALLMVGAQFSTGYARQLMDRLDLMLYDLRFNVLLPYSHPQPSAQPVVIIDIDERSLKEVGHWPWSRKTVAELVDKLVAAGVVSITFRCRFFRAGAQYGARRLPPTQPAATALAQSSLAGLRAGSLTTTAVMAQSIGKTDVTSGLHPASTRCLRIPREMPASQHRDSCLEAGAAHLGATHARGYTASIPALQQAARARRLHQRPARPRRHRCAVRRWCCATAISCIPVLALQTAMTYLLLDTVKAECDQQWQRGVSPERSCWGTS
jgi:hypothetical protein